MVRLQRHVIGGERQSALDEVVRLALVVLEVAHQHVDVGLLEVVVRPLALVLLEDVAPGDAGRPLEIEDGRLLLDYHREPVEPVGDLCRNQVELQTGHQGAGKPGVKKLDAGPTLHNPSHQSARQGINTDRLLREPVLAEPDVLT